MMNVPWTRLVITHFVLILAIVESMLSAVLSITNLFVIVLLAIQAIQKLNARNVRKNHILF